MNDARRIELMHTAVLRLGRFVAALDGTEGGTNVIGRMRDAQLGPAAQRCDAGPSGAHVADPTANAAMRGTDVASRDLVALDRHVAAIFRSVDAACELVDRYPARSSATDADRLALERMNGTGENGCENCSRIEGEAGGPRWEPVRPDSGPTDVGGRLDRRMLLCSWCYSRVELWGRVPSAGELQRHHRGLRVAWPKDVNPPK